MSFQYGDVILVHGNEPISYFIEFLTRSYWSHAMFALEDGSFAQMGPFGLLAKPDKLHLPYTVLRHRQLFYPSPKSQEILKRMKQTVGELQTAAPRFDYITMFHLGIHLLRKRMTASIAGEKGGPFTCSALVDYIYEQSGLDLRPDRDPADTTPANLEELASGDNPVFKVIYDSRQAEK